MEISEIEIQKKNIIKRYGEWTAHSILLAPNIYTVIGKETSSGRPAHYVRVAKEFLRQPLEKVAIIDLGCLEGMYSFEFAKYGARVVGIEGRLANIEKARFANRVLGYLNCDFVQDDVRNLSSSKYGTFDVVLSCGILYHLNVPDVFYFLSAMADVCTRIAIIDTHIAIENANKYPLSKPSIYSYLGEEYSGRYFTEFTNETPEQKLKQLWSSIDNERSFWFDRQSLYRAIKAAGFESVYEDLGPHISSKSNDRVTFVALKSYP